MDSAGGSQQPSSPHGSRAAHQPSAPASVHTAAEQPAADWASLPPELLRLCFLKCAKLVHGSQCLPLQKAAQLLASMSPCRAWRAVAIAEVPYQLQLEEAAELQHPLLRTLRISRLSLPRMAAAAGEDEEGLEGEAALTAWQPRDQQLAANITAHLSALLADGSMRGRLSSSLSVLSDLPAAAAVAHPQLLAGFQQLVGVQLRGDGGAAEVADRSPPSFFPASVQYISMSCYGMLRRMPWLPARPLVSVSVDSSAADVRGPQPRRAIKRLSLLAGLRLRASLQALSCFDCQHMKLECLYGVSEGAGMGTLELQPSAAIVDQWMHRALGMQAILQPQPSSPLRERLVPWGHALHPLFSGHAGLQTVRLVGARLQLAFPAVGWVSWPPAHLAPSTAAPGSEAADLTVAGLSLSLRLGSRPGTLELTVQRSAAGLEELEPL